MLRQRVPQSQERLAMRIVRLSGLVAAIIAVGYGWWGGVGSANGSPIVIWAASLASAGLILVTTGFARQSGSIAASGTEPRTMCAVYRDPNRQTDNRALRTCIGVRFGKPRLSRPYFQTL